jgi:hypothetical protein
MAEPLIVTLYKYVAETRLYGLDFQLQPELQAGGTILTAAPNAPVVRCTAAAGGGSTSDLTLGTPALSGTTAIQFTVAGGRAGAVYTLECDIVVQITLGTNRTLTGFGYLSVPR